MELVRGYGTRPTWKKALMFFILVSICTFMNLVGYDAAVHMNWPLYLDSEGTIIASMFGGVLPGVTVGLLSSIINGIINEPQAMSYGMLNVFIALFTVWACAKGWFKNIWKIILSVFIYAFLGGTLGAFLTIILYGFGQEDASVSIVEYIYSLGNYSYIGAEILGDTLVDIIDKSISVAFALSVYNLIPKKIRGQFRIHAWKQEPLTSVTVKSLINNKTRKHSLRTKLIFLVSVACMLVGLASVIISSLLYRQSIINFVSRSGLSITDSQLELKSMSFLVNEVALLVGIIILIVVVFLFFARYHIILPLNSMAYAAGKFTERDAESLAEIATLFESLKIETGDETENLYKVISEMLKSNAAFLEDIQKKNATISEMQNALIVVLADLVESRDTNTGDHIKSTAEYVELIMDEMLTEGIYKDQMTPKFISDVYRSAPLHDIGKISVSDVILNKPGKLTDEEFEIMKNHSLAGAEIIDRVIETIPDSDGGYLHEARNLALYHHEKWAGGGYPYGISGEEIPLSARIMAVADVFDALVSNRSYKKAFTFEEAIKIIEESAGTHFDPLVAGAFLNAKDRIRFVAEEKDYVDV